VMYFKLRRPPLARPGGEEASTSKHSPRFLLSLRVPAVAVSFLLFYFLSALRSRIPAERAVSLAARTLIALSPFRYHLHPPGRVRLAAGPIFVCYASSGLLLYITVIPFLPNSLALSDSATHLAHLCSG